MTLIRILADIALWRRGPRDLPASGPWVLGAMVVYALENALQTALATHGRAGVLAGVVGVIATSAVLAGILAIGGRLHRLAQTLLAVLGTDILLAPLVVLVAAGIGANDETTLVGLLLRLALLALVVWNLLIVAHILRAAFDATLAVGVALAVGCGVLSYLVTAACVGAPLDGAGT